MFCLAYIYRFLDMNNNIIYVGKTSQALDKRIAQHFTKGKEIYLQGRIEVTTSGEGENKRTYTNVVASLL